MLCVGGSCAGRNGEVGALEVGGSEGGEVVPNGGDLGEEFLDLHRIVVIGFGFIILVFL